MESTKKAKLRICWIIPTLDEGGAEKQLSLLASRIDRTRFEPCVIALTRLGPRLDVFEKASVPVISIDKRTKVDPFAYFRLRKEIKRFAPDIVHTWIFAANAYGRIAAKTLGVPVIFGGERCVDPWKREYEFWIDRWLAKRTTGIITNSSGVVAFYSQHGIASDRFTVIPNGVELPFRPQIDRAEIARRLGIDPRKRWIGAVGRLWRQKNYKEMIWAADMLRQALEDVVLVIVGDGPEREYLQEYIDKVRANEAVQLVGHRNDVEQIMPHFQLFWNASLYEGQSNSILEAMSFGIPVIASDIPGNRDLIDDRVSGFLFSPMGVQDLMKLSLMILKTPALRSQIVDAARCKVESDFNIEAMVRRHEELYLGSHRT